MEMEKNSIPGLDTESWRRERFEKCRKRGRGGGGGRFGGVKIVLLWRERVFSLSVTSHSWNIGKRVGLCWHVWGHGAYLVKWAFDKIDVVVFLFTSEKNLLHFNFVFFFWNCGKINFQYFLIYITIIYFYLK